MEQAAVALDAGAFKLWCYFSKNQDKYEFALSSKAVEETFGIKKKQYDNAVKQLIDKGYLVVSKGNNYEFNEIPVVSKGNNDVVSFSNNDVVSKGNNVLYPKDTRNITDTTYNNTNDNTEGNNAGVISFDEPKEEEIKAASTISRADFEFMGIDAEHIKENFYRVKATGKIIEVTEKAEKPKNLGTEVMPTIIKR